MGKPFRVSTPMAFDPGVSNAPANKLTVPEIVPFPCSTWFDRIVRVPSVRPVTSSVAPANTVIFGQLVIEPVVFNASVPRATTVGPV